MSVPDRNEMLQMVMCLGGIGRPASPEQIRAALLAKHPPEKVDAFLGATLFQVLSSVTVGDMLALAAAGDGD